MGRVCLSLTRLEELPGGLPEDAVIELRVDAFAELDDAAITDFVHGAGHDCLLTWRSPEEGGLGGPRPKGLWTWALDWGFAWVDVEERDLDARSPEAVSVPAHRRWVSRHLEAPPGSREDVGMRWGEMARHPAAVHKLVWTVSKTEDIGALLEWSREEKPTTPHAVFAQGAAGTPSRLFGGSGSGILFCAPAGRSSAPGQLSPETLVRDYAWDAVPEHPELFGVLGSPVRQSLSPRMHNAAFRRTGYAGLYLALDAPAPEPIFDWLRRGWFRGLSVTAPHKEAAAAAAQRRSERVERSGAANTLWMEKDRLAADNTDVLAAEELLRQLGVTPGDSVALLGTGGAARAVACALQTLGIPGTVYGRNADAGRRLAAELKLEYGGEPGRAAVRSHQALVNTLPVSPQHLFPEPRAFSGGVLDLLYSADGSPTAWKRWAESTGSPAVDGLAFLAAQGVHQFREWTGLDIGLDEFKSGLTA